MSTTIIGEHVTLKQVELNDTPGYVELLLNPKVMSMIYVRSSQDELKIKNTVSNYVARWSSGDLLAPLTIRNKNQEFVGYLNLNHDSCKIPGHVEVGLMLLPQYWNKSFGYDAFHNSIKYLHNLASKQYQVKGHNLNFIIATSHPNNIAPQKLLAKSCFKDIGKAYRGSKDNPRIFFYKSLLHQVQPFPFTPLDLLHDTI